MLSRSVYLAVGLLGESFFMENENSIYADTNQALTFQDLARALDRISQLTEIEDTPLPFDPDDYPLSVTPPPQETRPHRLWYALTFIVQVIVYGIMLVLILGIILLFVLIPVLVPR